MDNTQPNLHLIVYTSVYVGGAYDRNRDLDSIVAAAQRNNPAADITGVMFCQGGRFLQFLEGEESSLRQLMTKIEADARHDEIKYLFDESLPARGFAQWSMDFFDLNENEALSEELVETIRDGYKTNFATQTQTVVDIFRSFINEKTL